ncbi:MAG: DUF1937 family protein [bacterium]|nr:DUF1937 family protein [bacterium]
MITYLACPYTDENPAVSKRRFREVNKAAATMMARGEHVLSPISHTHPIAMAGELPKDWQFWQGYDTALLKCCGLLKVLCLDGWQESVGVQAEIEIAKGLGLPIYYIDSNARPLDIGRKFL